MHEHTNIKKKLHAVSLGNFKSKENTTQVYRSKASGIGYHAKSFGKVLPMQNVGNSYYSHPQFCAVQNPGILWTTQTQNMQVASSLESSETNHTTGRHIK